MKIIMSIKEMAALAGVAKQFDEIINPKDQKRTVQDMITQMINDFKEPEKHSFFSMKLDSEMNLVVECEADAVAKLLGIFKDFVSTMYPLYKAACECGASFGQRIQEVVDEYKEPEKEEDHPVPAAVVVVTRGAKVPDEESFEERFARTQEEINAAHKEMEERRAAFEKAHAERTKEIDRAVKKMRNKYKKDFKCNKCGRNAKLDPLANNHTCKNCGSTMVQIFQ